MWKFAPVDSPAYEYEVHAFGVSVKKGVFCPKQMSPDEIAEVEAAAVAAAAAKKGGGKAAPK